MSPIAARWKIMQSLDSRGCCARFLRADARCAGARALRCALSPFGLLYGVAMRLRRMAYQDGVFTSYDLSVPVVSVGNLSAGGTGKTPMVEYIVRRLQGMGRRPAILSRGYHAHDLTAEQARNDEALLLELRLPGVLHYAHPDRAASGLTAVAHGADCLVLDDGFQHLRVRRDLDIVLVDALKPLRRGRLIPAGDLREPLSFLRRAHAIVLTRADLLDAAALAGRRAEIAALAPAVPLIEAAHRATGLVDLRGEQLEPPERLAGKRVMLFCGIGNPQGFVETAQKLKAEVVTAQFFPDHHYYGPKDLGRLAAIFDRSGAEEVLTTEKDAVKFFRFLAEQSLTDSERNFLGRIRVLRIEMAIRSGEDILDGLLKKAVA